jgi:hypothetical protein
MWARLEFRPMLFTTMLLTLELWLLISVHTGRHSWRWLWALTPLFALHINLHGGWPQALLMLVAIMVARVAMEVRRRWVGSRVTSHLPLRHLIPVLVACGLALFLNPYGARLVYCPLEMQAPWIRTNAAE